MTLDRALSFTILGYPARLSTPAMLLLLAVAAALALLLAWSLRARHRGVLALVRARRLDPKVVPGASLVRPAAAATASVLGLSLLAVALAGPQFGERTELAKRYGSDLVVAIDASDSMRARDVLPSRIDRAKLELSALVDRMQGDRVGLVTFAGQAFVQCPLTTDYDAAKLFLRAIDPAAMPVQGTAIADALRTAARMLDASDRGAKGKAILLLTDGEDHEGDLDAVLAELEETGVRVYALGVGSREGAPIPEERDGRVIGYRRDRAGGTVVTRLEDRQLRHIAERTGGRYVAAAGADLGMGEVLAELERLEKSELESRLSVQYGEVYEWLATPGLLLLALGLVIRQGRRR